MSVINIPPVRPGSIWAGSFPERTYWGFQDLLGKVMEHVLQIGVPGISQDQWKWCN